METPLGLNAPLKFSVDGSSVSGDPWPEGELICRSPSPYEYPAWVSESSLYHFTPSVPSPPHPSSRSCRVPICSSDSSAKRNVLRPALIRDCWLLIRPQAWAIGPPPPPPHPVICVVYPRPGRWQGSPPCSQISAPGGNLYPQALCGAPTGRVDTDGRCGLLMELWDGRN